MVAVPSWLSAKVTPDGSVPFWVSDGTGNPVVVTVTAAMAVPAVVVAVGALVKTMVWSTSMVSDWLTPPAMLVAVTTIG